MLSARANSVDELCQAGSGLEKEDVAAIEDRLGLCENLAACEEDGDVLKRSGIPLLGGLVVDLH